MIRFIPYSDTYPLRIKILRNGKEENYTFELDALPGSFHLGKYIHNKLVGIVSFGLNDGNFEEECIYQLRGMAIDHTYQNQGIGKELIDQAEKILKAVGTTVYWCNARMTALSFYQKLGMQTQGKVFDVPGIGDHIVVFKYLDDEIDLTGI